MLLEVFAEVEMGIQVRRMLAPRQPNAPGPIRKDLRQGYVGTLAEGHGCADRATKHTAAVRGLHREQPVSSPHGDRGADQLEVRVLRPRHPRR